MALFASMKYLTLQLTSPGLFRWLLGRLEEKELKYKAF
jgi:hypothetical protein